MNDLFEMLEPADRRKAECELSLIGTVYIEVVEGKARLIPPENLRIITLQPVRKP
jgi:hypothetical protein